MKFVKFPLWIYSEDYPQTTVAINPDKVNAVFPYIDSKYNTDTQSVDYFVNGCMIACGPETQYRTNMQPEEVVAALEAATAVEFATAELVSSSGLSKDDVKCIAHMVYDQREANTLRRAGDAVKGRAR